MKKQLETISKLNSDMWYKTRKVTIQNYIKEIHSFTKDILKYIKQEYQINPISNGGKRRRKRKRKNKPKENQKKIRKK